MPDKHPQIIKVFKASGNHVDLENQINAFMDKFAEENPGFLNMAGVTEIQVQLIGGMGTQVVISFDHVPATDIERQLLEMRR